MKRHLIHFVPLAVLVSGCQQDHWLATIYPNKEERIVYVDYGEYTSLKKCRRAANSFLVYIGKTETGDYKCGKNCVPLNPRDPGPDPLMTCVTDER